VPTAHQIHAATDAQEPAIRAAFLAWVRETVADVRIAELERLVVRGDVEGIADSLGIQAVALAALLEAIRQAYTAGGAFGLTELPRLRAPTGLSARPGARAPYLRVRFDVRNPRAEAWLRDHSTQLVTRILAEQRAVIRLTLAAGAEFGMNPRAVALDLVGRIGVTGRRTGGVIGLTDPQAGFVTAARRQLLSGEPAQLRAYLTRELRDRRFDGYVRRAIESGRPVPRDVVDRMAGRYADRLLQLRGETIARTEALTAFNEARDETMRQAVETAGIEPEAVTKGWDAAGDARVRETHAAMDGQRVKFTEPFRSPSGALLMHPGDTSLGAGAAEVVACRCVSTARINHLRAVYRGR
jgi:hypothetical protein